MKIAIHINLTRKNAYDVACDVCRVLSKLDTQILMSQEFESVFSSYDICFLDYEEEIKNCDVLVTEPLFTPLMMPPNMIRRFSESMRAISVFLPASKNRNSNCWKI